MGVSIRFRKDKKLWIVTEIIQGKRSSKSFKGESEGKKQAQSYAAKRLNEIESALFNNVTMERPVKHTFLEGIERLINEYDINSQRSHIRNVIQFLQDDYFLDQSLIDKTRQMSVDLKQQNLSQSTINNRLQVVKRVLNLAYREWNWLDQPLADKVKKPSPKNERHVYLTAEQINQLLAAVPDSYPIERTVIALAALTGLRRGELLALEPSNIVQQRIILRPNQTKSGKARVVPIPQDAILWIMHLPFNTTIDKLRYAFEKAREKIGRKDLHFHDLRHSYASLLAQAGESLTTVRDLLGHSSLLVTSRYTHVFDQHLNSVSDKLPKLQINEN